MRRWVLRVGRWIWKRFLQRPLVAAIQEALAMRREETAAVPPEQWPDLFAVGLRQRQSFERGDGEKSKTPFAVRWRQLLQFPLQLEQKHQPMRSEERRVGKECK